MLTQLPTWMINKLLSTAVQINQSRFTWKFWSSVWNDISHIHIRNVRYSAGLRAGRSEF